MAGEPAAEAGTEPDADDDEEEVDVVTGAPAPLFAAAVDKGEDGNGAPTPIAAAERCWWGAGEDGAPRACQTEPAPPLALLDAVSEEGEG